MRTFQCANLFKQRAFHDRLRLIKTLVLDLIVLFYFDALSQDQESKRNESKQIM